MKRLLKAVFGMDVFEYNGISEGKIWYTFNGDSFASYMNIYEFQTRCKEWAHKKGYDIWSGHDNEIFGCSIYFNDESEDDFFNDTEYKTVFDACNWILGELENPEF